VGYGDSAGSYSAMPSGTQMVKKQLPGKGEQKKLPTRQTKLSTIVCPSCDCVSGYGLPPSVEECPCICHDTARLWWSIRPWRLEL
jgi:hypothetical protein